MAKPKSYSFKTSNQYFAVGQEDFKNGKSRDDNPVRFQKASRTADYIAWRIGWDYAYLKNLESGLNREGYPRASTNWLTQFDDADHPVDASRP